MTHERSSLTRSTCLQTNRNVCSAVVLQAKNEDVGRPGLSFVAALLECIRLQLRPTIHRNTCPGDPPSTIVGEECDHVDGNSRPLISVTDTGVGLPNRKTDRIFNAFFTTKPRAQTWDWRSHVPLSSRTVVASEPPQTADEGQRFTLRSPVPSQ